MNIKAWLCVALCAVAPGALAQGSAGHVWMEPVTGGTHYAGSPYAVDVYMNTGTAQPDTIQLDLFFNTGYLYLPFSELTFGGTPPAFSFSNPKIVMGPWQTISGNQGLNLQVNHDEAEPGRISVVRAGGNNVPAAIPSENRTRIKLFTVTFTASTAGTSQVTGTVTVLRNASLQVIGTPSVIAYNAVATGRPTVYLNFATTGTETGEAANPFKTLLQAVNGVAVGGTVVITPGDTPATMRITKAMRLTASGYRVRLGYGAKSVDAGQEAPMEGEGALSTTTESWLALLDGLTWLHGSRPASPSVDEAEGATEEVIYARALPVSGSAVAGEPTVFALRLRSDVTPIGTGLRATVEAPGTAASAVEVVRVSANDVWVIHRGGAAFVPGDTVTLRAQAPGVEVAQQTFTIVADASPAGEAVAQPGYGDFDTTDLDLHGEANDQNLVYPATVEDAPGAVGPAYTIAPSRVFDTPQRIWVALPAGTSASALELLYYHDEDGAWYSAEQVAGWLVPGSELQLELEGAHYYGFAVRHGGTLQLRHRAAE